MKYRKKPVVIEAVQWEGIIIVLPKWFHDAIDKGIAVVNRDNSITIKTLEGDHRADLMDYIIRGVVGEMYPCKEKIFEMTYEAVNE